MESGHALLIRSLQTPEEMRGCEEIQKEVWGAPDREIVPVVELISASKAGGCVAGAFHGEKMVGFVYGGWGLSDGDVYHYSRMVAVRSRWRGKGLGRKLKGFQRDFVLEKGVRLVRWTFDPLEGGNAALNVAKLGVVADEYIEDYYGTKEDALNRGLPTDRYFVRWFLDSPRVEERMAGAAKRLSIADILHAGPPALSSCVGPSDLPLPDPQAFPENEPAIHLEIPWNVQVLKERDIETAASWRVSVREASQRAFALGFRVEEFATGILDNRRRSAYLLKSPKSKV